MGGESGICALTGLRGRYVRCHLVPEALYPHRDHQLKVVYSDARGRPRRSPIGAYDKGLVTRAGEDILESYDQYGIRFLRGQEGGWTFSPEHSEWLVQNFDYAKVRLFLLSVLWRCGASSLFGPELIDISAHAIALRNMVRDGDAGDPNTFPIMAERYDHAPERLPVFPFKTRREVDRVDHIALFGGFEIYITASWPYTDATQTPRVLCPGKPWLIHQASWRGSGREQIARASVDENDNRWPGWMA